jgi:NTE family protein
MTATPSDPTTAPRKTVAIACQGGGMHASFGVGVLTRILEDLEENNRFDLVGLSGTSAGALTTLMAWYGLAPKHGEPGSPGAAKKQLNEFWDGFTAITTSEKALNAFASFVLAVEARETLGIAPRAFGLNPGSTISQVVNTALPHLGVRQRYFDFQDMLAEACPEFDRIDWDHVRTRLMVGATEIKHGIETVFDSDLKMMQDNYDERHRPLPNVHSNPWRTRLPLSLEGVAASGTLPTLRRTQVVGEGLYWDGLYSQNPPVREFVFNTRREYVPDEIWIVRINPQQCVRHPTSLAEIEDRQNELMGNLSLDKELDMILTVNDWIDRYQLTPDQKQQASSDPGLARATLQRLEEDFKKVKLRTIKMTRETAAGLTYASKFDRSRDFVNRLRTEGYDVASQWLVDWPLRGTTYPDDAGDPLPPTSISGDPSSRWRNERV